MPDKDGFPTADEIINGGPTKTPELIGHKGQSFDSGLAVPDSVPVAKVPLTPDQQKAVALVLSGRPFIALGMVPTTASGKPSLPGEEATGCDFATAMGGDSDTLLAVKDHLGDVIDRLYKRHGLL